MAKFLVHLDSSIVVEASGKEDAIDQVESLLSQIRERKLKASDEGKIFARMEAVDAQSYTE